MGAFITTGSCVPTGLPTQKRRAPGDGLAKCCPLLCSNMAAYRGPKHVITNSDMLLAVGDHMFWPPVSSHVRAQKRRNLARPSSPGAPAFVCWQTCRNTPGLVDQHQMFWGGCLQSLRGVIEISSMVNA